MQPGDPERPQQVHLPVISEKTRQKLLEELGLHIDLRSAQIAGIEYVNPVAALINLPESVFGSIIVHNSKFAETILRSLNEVYSSERASYMDVDAATKGMAVVLEAYQLETDHGVFSLLDRLNDGDLTQVHSIIRDVFTHSSGAGTPILERVLNVPRIPEHQINLNFCLNEASEKGENIFKRQAVQGGVAMYRVLSHLWPKLSGSIPPSPPSQA